MARFLGELFNSAVEELGATYGSVRFEGEPGAQLGILALSYEGAVQTSVPVEPIQ